MFIWIFKDILNFYYKNYNNLYDLIHTWGGGDLDLDFDRAWSLGVGVKFSPDPNKSALI